ncbi:MAG TPA: FAD-binding protein [Gammaproteobacteria bacterium]
MKRRAFCAAGVSVAALSFLPLRRVFAADVPALTKDGAEIVLRARDVEDFQAGLRGPLLLPGQDGYDEARRIWNGAFDRRPALIARCAGAADVMRAVGFAKTHDLLVAVRGGGHSLSGQSVCDGGLMIDLSRMRGIRVNPDARRVRAEPGVLLGELDRETQAFGLATPAGTVSHTGIAGLTLGGGFGRIARKHGLTCDNLVAADVVTADGRLVHASEDENPDLLWGLKGGGGNFGIVTSFEYRLHAVGPMMYGGPILYPYAVAGDVLRFFADYALEAPDELNVDAALITAPNGERVLALDTCFCGPLADAERQLEPLRRAARPVQDHAGPTPYVRLQTSMDETYHYGIKAYERSGFLRRIEPTLVDEVVERLAASNLPSAQVIFVHHGGAIARVRPDATAFWHRDAQHSMLIQGHWTDPAQSDEIMGWARSTWDALESHTNGFYVNTIAEDDPQRRVRGTYGENYPRLVALKNAYDPANLFRRNANIEPTV